jgi:hypothetical protein
VEYLLKLPHGLVMLSSFEERTSLIVERYDMIHHRVRDHAVVSLSVDNK